MKCTKTMSGKHDFVDTSTSYCWTEVIYANGTNIPVSHKNHCRKVKGDMKCRHCGVVNDIPV